MGTLKALGCTILELDADENHPDGVFVEDTALVLPELAIMTRPGAASRRGELPAVAAVLSEHRSLASIEQPGTLDGGDVLRIGKKIYVGSSERSNQEGTRQLTQIVAPYGYSVERIALNGCLHLKSACTFIGEDTLLANTTWVDPTLLDVEQVIAVPEAEPFAANALRIEDSLLIGEQFSLTTDLLQQAGFQVVPVKNTELAKAEGGLTCSSVIWT